MCRETFVELHGIIQSLKVLSQIFWWGICFQVLFLIFVRDRIRWLEGLGKIFYWGQKCFTRANFGILSINRAFSSWNLSKLRERWGKILKYSGTKVDWGETGSGQKVETAVSWGKQAKFTPPGGLPSLSGKLWSPLMICGFVIMWNVKFYATISDVSSFVSIRFLMMEVMPHIWCWRNVQKPSSWSKASWRNLSPGYIVYTSSPSLENWAFLPWMSTTQSPRYGVKLFEMIHNILTAKIVKTMAENIIENEWNLKFHIIVI